MWNESHIKIFGLDKSDIQLLNAALVRPLSVMSIATTARIPRTSILYRLSLLKKRGLTKESFSGKRRVWQSISPDAFVSNNSSALRTATKGIETTTVSPTTSIVIYRGAHNLMRVFEKISKLHKNERLSAIQPNVSFQSAITRYPFDEIIRLNTIIRDKKLVVEGIVHEKAVASAIASIGKNKADSLFKTFIGRLEDYASIPDDFLDIHSEAYVFRESSVIMSPEKGVAIEIIDKDVAEMMRTMITSLKEHVGRRYSQTELMERFVK